MSNSANEIDRIGDTKNQGFQSAKSFWRLRIIARKAKARTRKSVLIKAAALLTCAASTFSLAYGQKTIDSKVSGRHEQFRLNFPIKRPKNTPPYDWKQIGAMMDAVEEGVRDDGTVVIKKPDIWSQARMTRFRMEFYKQFDPDATENRFSNVLSGRRARSDQQSIESATTISATLSSIADSRRVPVPILSGLGRGSETERIEAFNRQLDLNKAQSEQVKSEADTRKAIAEETKAVAERDTAMINAAKSLLDSGDLTPQAFNSLINENGNPLSNLSSTLTPGALGIEPTVYLDEKKRYFDHLNQIRRVNLGDDLADSAGYSMTLARIPVSLQPGARTLAGHGAILNVTVKPDFGNQFLQETYRNLVVTDIVDLLTPMVYSVIESGSLEAYSNVRRNFDISKFITTDLISGLVELEEFKVLYRRITKDNGVDPSHVKPETVRTKVLEYFTWERRNEFIAEVERLHKAFISVCELSWPYMESDEKADFRIAMNPRANDDQRRLAQVNLKKSRLFTNRNKDDNSTKTTIDRGFDFTDRIAEARKTFALIAEAISKINAIESGFSAADSRRSMIVAPVDIDDVYSPQNVLLELAERYQQTQNRQHPSISELRIFLNRSVQAAYDYVQTHFDRLQSSPVNGGVSYFEAAYLAARDRKIASGDEKYDKILRSDDTHILNLYRGSEVHDGFVDLVSPFLDKSKRATSLHSILSWAVVVDCGLLNQRLKEEMQRYDGRDGFTAPPDLPSMRFYVPFPSDLMKHPELSGDYITAEEAFKNFVAARWPVICFALDPVTDQQNIGDSASLRRDLQLAMSLAFSSGQITGSQFNRFRRLIGEDSETIALNKTVTAYSHSNDTFGWRFYPRFQNAPIEPSNLHSFTNQMIFGGPPRNYQMKNSKLEPGQRELTAVLIVPSIVQGLRFDVNSNWFPLTKPDNMTIPNTRMLWQGQQLMQVRQAMQWLCDHNEYRPGDIDRMMVKLDQLEKMLPLQTETIRIPYENNQSGYELFTPGLSALGPILIGTEGINELPSRDDKNEKEFWVVAYGKNLSLTDTYFIMGGKTVNDDSSVKVISREIVKLKVPKDAVVSEARDSEKKRRYIELRAITPTGISNVVEIPVASKTVEPKTVSTFQMLAADTVVYIDFEPDNGSLKSARVENDKTELKVKDNTIRVVDNIPRHVKAIRLDFLKDDQPQFSKSLDAIEIQFEKGIADLSKVAVHLIETAFSEKSKLAHSNFEENMSYTVKAAILVDKDPLAIPLDSTFKVVLKHVKTIAASPDTTSQKAPSANVLETARFEELYRQSRKQGTVTENRDESDLKTGNAPISNSGSPFSPGVDSKSMNDTDTNSEPLRFGDLLQEANSRIPDEAAESKRELLPPALSSPSDSSLERQSFQKTNNGNPVNRQTSGASARNPSDSGTGDSQIYKKRPSAMFTTREMKASQSTGIPLPK